MRQERFTRNLFQTSHPGAAPFEPQRNVGARLRRAEARWQRAPLIPATFLTAQIGQPCGQPDDAETEGEGDHEACDVQQLGCLNFQAEEGEHTPVVEA